MTEPNSFEQSLRNYDPLLSLRWGPFVNAWVVDRRAEKGISKALWDTLEWAVQQPSCEPIDRERLLSAKLGNRPVLHTKLLGKHVFDTLYKDDLLVHGTKIVDRHMKRIEDEREKKRNRDDTTRATADGLHYLNRKHADFTPEQQKEVFAEASGKVPARKRKPTAVIDKLGAPPRWMERDAGAVAVGA